MEARAGVITAAEVSAPMSAGTGKVKWLDLSAPSTWAVIFFVAAWLYLVVL